jgi:hypothetical protein
MFPEEIRSPAEQVIPLEDTSRKPACRSSVGAPHWRLIWQSGHRCQICGVNFDAAFPNAQIVSGHREPQ